jgi:subtilisin-like proprotein convertase family protein
VKRLALAAALVAASVAQAAGAATNEYSTGNIRVAIAPGATVERGLPVPHKGPVSFVRVWFRIATPNSGDLAVSLVSARGTVVPLVTHRGTGAGFGGGRGCNFTETLLDSDMDTNPIADGSAPFTDGPYRAEGSLKKLYGEEARGRWRLRIENTGTHAATLECFTLDISRAVPQTLTARRGSLSATVTFTERNFQFSKTGIAIVRAGKKVLDTRLTRLRGCRDCDSFRPTHLSFRDLDGGEPELILEMFTGGAHCCSVTLLLRWDARSRSYKSKLVSWGNYGYRLVDLDGDKLPEFSAFDERFVYAFTAYVFSAAPVQISQYRNGALIDVTREFPREIEKEAAELKATYTKERKAKDVDLRGFIAAYVADLYLLDRGEEAQAFLRQAQARGDLRGFDGPTGAKYITALTKFLRANGYIR